MKQNVQKKIALFLSAAVFSLSLQQAEAQFAKGNLVILRVGSDTETVAQNSNAYPVFLDEISKTGTLLKSVAVPTTGSFRLTMSGTSTSDGQMTLSSDSTQLVIAGYDAAPGTVSLTKSYSSVVNRVINAVKSTGVFSRPASSDTFQSGNNFRSAATNTGTNYWGAGATTGTTYYGKKTPAILQSLTVNTRVINIYKGEIYFSTGSITGDSGIGIYHLGTGLPITGTQTFSKVVLTGATSSPYAFIFNPAHTVLYVATDDSIAGGIQKYTKTGTSWTYVKTFSVGAKLGCRGLTADFSTAKYPTVYATTSDYRVIKFKDSLSSPLITTIYTAPKNTIIHGIQFCPIAKKKAALGAPDAEEADAAAAPSKTVTNIKIFPNPANDIARIVINGTQAQKYNLSIINISGRLLQTQQGVLNAGTNQVNVNVAALPKGFYIAQIVTPSGKQSVNFIKE